MLEHGHEEIAERFVVIAFESVVLAVFEASTGEEDWEVGVVVLVRIAHVAAEEDHRAVEQSGIIFALCGEDLDELAEQHHLLAVGVFELLHLLRCLTVMTEAVITFGGAFIVVDFEGWRGEGIHHEGDDAGGVGLEGELRHGEHEIELFKDALLVLDVGGLGQLGEGLRLQLPLAGGEQALLHLTHGGEVLIEARTVIAAEVATELLRVIEQRVEDAAAFIERVELPFHRSWIALQEHASKQGRSAVLGGQQNAIACPGETAVRFVDVHAEVQRGESRELAELFNRELVERDLIAKPALRRSACGSEEAVLRAVTAIHIRMRHAAEDAELSLHLG